MPASREPYPVSDITGALLAGGQARRMGGNDKGLITVAGRPMIAHLLEILEPQVGAVIISANRNRERYARFNHPVVTDTIGGYSGPLAGIASVMQACDSEYILTAPCDAPLLCGDFAARMFHALQGEEARLCVAHDGERLQPVFSLLHRSLLPELLASLEAGERKVSLWFTSRQAVVADFSDQPQVFLNINTPEQRSDLEQQLSQKGTHATDSNQAVAPSC